MKTETHILLVDDQVENLQFIDARLKALGFRTTIVSDGSLALEVAQRDPVQLAVLDVTMPELNGYQTCRELKRLYKDMRVIILTGKTEPADRFWAFQSGADVFFNKPADPSVVVQRICSLLE